MGKPDDATIIAELKKQSDRGYRLLWCKYYRPFILITTGIYGVESEDAKEIVSDAILKAGQAIDTFEARGEKCFQYWLRKILKNIIIDCKRKKKKSPQIFRYDESESEKIDDFRDLEDGTRQIARSRTYDFLYGINIKRDERIEIITTVMKEFQENERLDLWNYFLETSHEEIAQYRKVCSKTASRKYINRLVHRFFDILSEKTGLDRRSIYEGWKERNRETSTGGIIAGEVTDP
ncbi:MAG: sigma-70 family RNA polymerase sigma factor [Bacteroidota bacterium]|jgi:RNA polymerase sigma factor (sigma-70 family)